MSSRRPELNLKIKAINFHRNGIDGAGFYAVEFSERDGGRVTEFIATIFPNPGEKKRPVYYAVVSPGDMSQRWRGDIFIDQLWDAIVRTTVIAP